MAKGIAHREWRIDRNDFTNEYGSTDEASFRHAVENEAALNVHMQERLGIAIVSAPVRRQAPDGRWFTQAYVYQTATVPSARAAAPDVEEEPAEEALIEDLDVLVEAE